jgi:hypothetical protein
VWRESKGGEDAKSSDSEVDEDYNFFKDSIYHEHKAEIRQRRNSKLIKRQKLILVKRLAASVSSSASA